MSYLKKEWVIFTIGMIALVLGNVGIFAVPLYVGLVIDDLSKY